ncbi:nucleotidyl transferase AbiEii/AbiGii toxin family protein [Paratissierella segnis]|jgi:predicted nucleotidyltransferase component of viral defense system|uniref:Nucleotidyl transferase AbiEii/AbiGii toxin family protein n=1 Tax=Paratissierella segnis TaxID=2763679 RepID=A0A926IJ74_9FIRM|nr:nucleotidyl transferase AbiEii/AbiGii toxin family protein [Paratissierella segnis]MBC8587729.1 nucleotidyl transferase AbiEii/AbiGii toxin family protein [Paratissierella segnis]
MSRKAMSLKAKIRNLAKEKDISAQVILQNYMFERFLERLSKSNYKNNFILKGGMLIAALVGIDNRSTMDMDATIKNYPITIDSLTKAITEICNIEVDDDVNFSFMGIEPIRDDDIYGGYRVGIRADYDTIITPLSIDITTGDVITPREVFYSFKMIFDEGTIGVWAYNIETVLAEKLETILQRGELNTRPRDFYDIYILVNTQEFNSLVFSEALKKTIEHRETIHILNDTLERIKAIETSEILKDRWVKYSKNYPYAEDISYEDTVKALKMLLWG